MTESGGAQEKVCHLEDDIDGGGDHIGGVEAVLAYQGSTGHQAMSQEHQEDMDRKVLEVSEHALMDQWQMELGIEVLDDEYWKMLYIELQHGNLDMLLDIIDDEDTGHWSGCQMDEDCV